MEGFAKEPVRRHQEVHRGLNHQDQFQLRMSREGKNILEQTQHDIGPGTYCHAPSHCFSTCYDLVTNDACITTLGVLLIGFMSL